MSPYNSRRTRIVLNGILAGVLILGLTELLLRIPALLSGDPELPERHPTRTHVLAVGDSFTRSGLPDAEAYPAHLQGLLDEKKPGQFHTVNLGQIGVSSTSVADQLPGYLERYQPETVIVWIGANIQPDMLDPLPLQLGDLPSQLLLRSEIYRFIDTGLTERQVEAEVQKVTATQAERDTLEARQVAAMEEFVEAEGDLGVRELLARDYRRIVDIALASGTRVILVEYPFDLPKNSIALANQAMRAISKERNIPLISSAEAAIRVPEPDRKWRWAAHPGSEINLEIARAIVSALLPPDADFPNRPPPEKATDPNSETLPRSRER